MTNISIYTLKVQMDIQSFEEGSISKISGQNIMDSNSIRTKVFYRDVSYASRRVYHVRLSNRDADQIICPLTIHFYDSNHHYLGEQECLSIPKKITTAFNSNGEELTNTTQEDFVFLVPSKASYLRMVLESPKALEKTLLESLANLKIFIEYNPYYINSKTPLEVVTQPKTSYILYEKINLDDLVMVANYKLSKNASSSFKIQVINNFSVMNFDTLTLSDKDTKTYNIEWNGYFVNIQYTVDNNLSEINSKEENKDVKNDTVLSRSRYMTPLHQILSPTQKRLSMLADEQGITFAVAERDPDNGYIYDEDYTFYELIEKDTTTGRTLNPPQARITHIGHKALTKKNGVSSYVIPVFVEVDDKEYVITKIGSNVCSVISEDYTRGIVTGISVSKLPNKTKYLVGESLDVDGIEVVLEYSKTKETDPIDIDLLNIGKDFDKSTVNPEAKVVVTYDHGNSHYETEFYVSVNAETENMVLKSIQWNNGPRERTGEVYSHFNFNGISLKLIFLNVVKGDYSSVDVTCEYTDTAEEIIYPKDFEFSDYDMTKAGEKEITMIYHIPEYIDTDKIVLDPEKSIQDGDYIDQEGFAYTYRSDPSDVRKHTFIFKLEAVEEEPELIENVLKRAPITVTEESLPIGASIRTMINQLIVQRYDLSPGLTFEMNCFKDCTNLDTLVVEGPVIKYEANSFYGSGVRMLVVREDTHDIGASAFENCSHLKAILIQENSGITYGSRCFYNITIGARILVSDENRYTEIQKFDAIQKRLVSLEIGTVVDLNENLTDALGSIYAPIETNAENGEDRDSIVQYQVVGSLSTIFSAIIPTNVMVNGDIYPVVRIKEDAYLNRTQLATVHIFPEEITIGDRAFQNCSKLSKFSWESESKNRKITFGKGVFKGCVVLNISDAVSSMTEIPDEIFMDCHNTRNLFFNQNLQSIGKKAFFNNEMSELMIPQSVRSIGDEAFSKCVQLKEIFMNTLECTIGTNVFSDCGGPITMYVPNENMSTLWSQAQNVNTKFTFINALDIYLDTKTTKKINDVICYPDAVHNIYYSLSNENGQYTATMEDASEMTSSSIENGFFYAPSYVFTVDINNGGVITQYKVTSIAPSCFSGIRTTVKDYTTMENIPILSHFVNTPYIDSIPERCFEGSTLQSIDLGKATTIGNYAFANTEISDEKDVVLPKSAFRVMNGKYVGPLGLFKGCKFERVEHLFDGISFIPDETFEDCIHLKTVIINHEMVLGDPNRKDSDNNPVRSRVFMNCPSMENIYILAPIQWQKGIFLRGTLKDTSVNRKGWNQYNGTRIHVLNYSNYLQLKEDTSTYYHLNPMVAGYTDTDLRQIPIQRKYDFDESKMTLMNINIYSESELVSEGVPIRIYRTGEMTFSGASYNDEKTKSVWVPSHLISSYPVENETYYTVLELEYSMPSVASGNAHFINRWNDVCNLYLPYVMLEIPQYYASECRNLVNIQFPKYLKSIESYAFIYCYSLIPPNRDRNTLPSTLERIEDFAFAFACFQSKTEIKFELPSRTYSYGDGMCLDSNIHKVRFFIQDFSQLVLGAGMFVDINGYLGYRAEIFCDKKNIYDIISSSSKKIRGYDVNFDYIGGSFTAKLKTGDKWYGPNDGVSNYIKRNDAPSDLYPDTVHEDLSAETYSKMSVQSTRTPLYVDGNRLFSLEETLSYGNLQGKSIPKTIFIPDNIHTIGFQSFSNLSISQLIFEGDVVLEEGCFEDMKTLPKEIFFLGSIQCPISDWDHLFRENETRFYVSDRETYQYILNLYPYLIHRIAFVHRSISDWNYNITEDQEGFLYQRMGTNSLQMVWFNNNQEGRSRSEALSLNIPSYVLEGSNLLRVSSIQEGILSGYTNIEDVFVDTSVHLVPDLFEGVDVIVSNPRLRNVVDLICVMVVPYEVMHTYTDGYALYQVNPETQIATFDRFLLNKIPQSYHLPNKIVISLNPYTTYIVQYSEEENHD